LKPKVHAFVLGYHAPEDSIECLASLIDLPGIDQLYYLDNGSTPEELAQVRAAFPDLDVLRFVDNVGYSGAFNGAVAHCIRNGADWVLAANNDLIFDREAMIRMLDAAGRDPEAGILVPKIYYHDAPEQIWSAGFAQRVFPPTIIHRKTAGPEAGEFDLEERVDFLPLCTALVSAEAVKKIGLLDPTFFFYCEDTDYSKRMRDAGYSLRYVPDSKVWHKSPKVGADKRGKDHFWHHYGRSERIFCRKYPSVYPGIQMWLHLAYLHARTVYEGGWSGLSVFRKSLKEGREAEMLPIPNWDDPSVKLPELI